MLVKIPLMPSNSLQRFRTGTPIQVHRQAILRSVLELLHGITTKKTRIPC